MSTTPSSPQPTLQSDLKAAFTVIQGSRKQEFLVRKERVVIGSVESADVKIPSPSVAPIHAVLEIKWGSSEALTSARILDLASPGGVIVNGNRVVNQELRNGDRIQIGDAQIVFGFKRPTALIPDAALLLIDASEVTPIFDYRPSVKEALEVVYSWNNTILDVKHFLHTAETKNSTVTLGGDQRSDFVVPPVFSGSGEHLFVTQSAGRWTLHLDSKMRGVLYIGGQLSTIEDYRRSRNGGVTATSPQTVELGENDFAKVELAVGKSWLQFYLSQTIPPPVLRKKTTLIADPFLAKMLLASIAFTMAFVVAVSQMQPKPIEADQVPEVVATILYHPERYSMKNFQPVPKAKNEEARKQPPPPEKPKKSEIDFTKPKENQGKVAQTKSAQPGKHQASQKVAREGEGARAKGSEGQRGTRNAQPDKTHQNAAQRTSPRAGQGRGGTISQTQDNGNVQMLKGATNKILDLLGGSGEKLGKSGSKLSGFGGFSTEGNNGLALSGGGKGGGGNADTLLGGLGNKGRGGGRVGTGLGAEGTGTGIVGGKTRVELNVGGGDETVVVGAIDRDAIDAAIRAHRDEFRYCYEREVNAGQPNLAGKVVSAFVIGGSGRASQMAVASSSMNNANVERCVLGVIGRIQFPLPAGGVPVTIKYPFAYNNSSK